MIIFISFSMANLCFAQPLEQSTRSLWKNTQTSKTSLKDDMLMVYGGKDVSYRTNIIVNDMIV